MTVYVYEAVRPDQFLYIKFLHKCGFKPS